MAEHPTTPRPTPGGAREQREDDCYCVCHSMVSSKAWCEHCRGDNSVGRVPRCAGASETTPRNGSGLCVHALPCPTHGGKKVTDLTAGERFIICNHIVEVCRA